MTEATVALGGAAAIMAGAVVWLIGTWLWRKLRQPGLLDPAVKSGADFWDGDDRIR